MKYTHTKFTLPMNQKFAFQMSSLRSKVILIASVIALSGCYQIRQARCPSGEMGADGKVCPCHDSRTDPQACGEAIFNAKHIQDVQIGHTKQDVLKIVGRSPDERGAKMDGVKSIEIWKYLTNYQNTIYTVITFSDGRVTSIDSQTL